MLGDRTIRLILVWKLSNLQWREADRLNGIPGTRGQREANEKDARLRTTCRQVIGRATHGAKEQEMSG